MGNPNSLKKIAKLICWKFPWCKILKPESIKYINTMNPKIQSGEPQSAIKDFIKGEEVVLGNGIGQLGSV